MRYHRLIHLKGSSAALDTSERCGHGPRHNNAGHFDITTNENLLNVVAKIEHGGKRLLPNCFLSVAARRRQSSRRVDHSVGQKQIVEGVEVSGVPGSKPPVDDGF